MPKKCQNGCCAAFKPSTFVDCGPIWFKRIALAQFFAPIQDNNTFVGGRAPKKCQKCLKMPKNCQNGCCAAFKASTSVDCGPIWFKRIALAQFFAPLQDKNILLGIEPLKMLKMPKNA